MQIVDNVGFAELVGRDLERRVLEEALEEARHGRGHTVLITGEDGIGKSRLALEAARSGRHHDMRVLEGRASPVGPTVALRPLAEALACLFRDGQGPDGKVLGSYRAVLGGLVPEYGPASERELPPVGGGGGGGRAPPAGRARRAGRGGRAGGGGGRGGGGGGGGGGVS
ncbi:AAA family ATPase, partial [Streptomyces sp. NPDC102365]|uniref:AAA family ATPase n=1 Tax=Streptomyces sp. NPDC102365 TaxID=3366162 RepID=UPI00380E01FC